MLYRYFSGNTLRYLDQQHSVCDKKSHVEFLNYGHAAVKQKNTIFHYEKMNGTSGDRIYSERL